jgi:hypothetical protein
MTQLALVPEDRSEWLRCRPWIEKAIVHCRGTHVIEDIEVGIENGTYRFFAMPNCAAVVRIVEYPRARCLNYFLVGGDLKELMEKMEPHITAWAKTQGCTLATLVGREGWLRTLMPLGYKKSWSAAYKDI